MTRIAPGELADQSVNAVHACRTLPKQKWAFAWDHLNPALLAELHCLWADRTFPDPAVHPDTANPGRGAISDNNFGDFRGSHQNRAVDKRLNVLNSDEARPAKNFLHVGIHREYVVSAPKHFFE